MVDVTFKPRNWVLKVSDWEATKKFLIDTLEMKELEFYVVKSGIDENSKEPFERRILGYGRDQDCCFSLCIEYYYNKKEKFAKGNDFVHVGILATAKIMENVKKSEYTSIATSDEEGIRVQSPEGYTFLISETDAEQPSIGSVRIHSHNAWETIPLYIDVFGMKEYESHHVRALAIYKNGQDFALEFAESLNKVLKDDLDNRFTISVESLEDFKTIFEEKSSIHGLEPLEEVVYKPENPKITALVVHDKDGNQIYIVENRHFEAPVPVLESLD